MKTKIFFRIFFGFLLISGTHGNGQDAPDKDLARAHAAYRSLSKAGTLNGISLGFGVASNIEMILLGGFPLEYQDGTNPAANMSHMILSVTRLTFSILPPIQIAKARRALEPWQESPEMAASCKKLFASMGTAQVLTAITPVLCITGGIIMGTAAVTEHGDIYEYSAPENDHTLKAIGWICIGAGLASSVAAAVMIGDAKKELSKKIGTLKLNAGPSGVGLLYSLPQKH